MNESDPISGQRLIRPVIFTVPDKDNLISGMQDLITAVTRNNTVV